MGLLAKAESIFFKVKNELLKEMEQSDEDYGRYYEDLFNIC